MTTAASELILPFNPRGACADIFGLQVPQLVLSGPAGTGKSRTILEKVNLACLKHPNLRALMVRKTRRSLTESAMVTFEKHVLGPELGTRVLWKSSMQQYQYRKNGSILAVAGLDKSSKVMSSEWDLIYVQEATELDEDDWESLTTRLRNGKNSYQQIIGDCNPDAPTHWLKQRANSGKTIMLESRHEDNPLLFRDDGTMTEEGARYIGMLEELTGVRLARYRYGIWAAASGTVYEQDWDRARNVIDRFPIPKEWPRYLAVDFGYTNPFVCAWWAMDPDGRLFCYREIYKTKTLVEDHAKRIQALSRWGQDGGDPLPREIICDHDAEDRATLERHLGLITRPAHKSVRDGIQAVAARLRPAGDGKPRLMYFRDALVERDMELSRQKKPTCTIEEPESYVWAETNAGIKEEPVKENDHGCLVAGTMVTTIRGEVPIEQIAAGDYVLTRNGYKPVIAAGMTAQSAEVFTAQFSNGATLTGTGNHPIYLIKQGYTPLRDMRYGDIIEDVKHYRKRHLLWEKIRENQKSLSTKVSSLDATPNHLHGAVVTTIALTQVIEKQVCCDFIRKYGKTQMARFQRDTKFITRTETHLIMPWIIWNVSRKKSIRAAMNYMRTRHVDSFCESMLLQKYERQQNNGMVQKKVKRGMVRWLGWLGMKRNSMTMFVNNVVNHFNLVHWTGTKLSSVPVLVSQHGGVKLDSITKHASVSTAETSSRSIITARNVSAQQNVQREQDTQVLLKRQEPARYVEEHSQRDKVAIRSTAHEHAQAVAVCSISKSKALQPVYNLTVENAVSEGEYFANGILVHNCDQSRYIVARFDLKPTTVRYSQRVY